MNAVPDRAEPSRCWALAIESQARFHLKARGRRRTDDEMDWEAFESSPSGRWITWRKRLKRALLAFGARVGEPTDLPWFRANSVRLWETREMLADPLSRQQFDAALLLRITDHRRYYFPRVEFRDLLVTEREDDFEATGLPRDYLGVPLRRFSLRRGDGEGESFNLVATKPQLASLNSFRQYLLPAEDGLGGGPAPGDVVLDCGACIGDFTVLFAAWVGRSGQVHAFDPVPVHIRFCAHQAELNPALSGSIHLNQKAVGSTTRSARRSMADANRITPGNASTEGFDAVSIDDYVTEAGIRVDFIKMDIEGAESEAIMGAADTIRRFRPKLAISIYHRPEDLWEIPRQLAALVPDYRFRFGHHSPVQWESVLYAFPA